VRIFGQKRKSGNCGQISDFAVIKCPQTKLEVHEIGQLFHAIGVISFVLTPKKGKGLQEGRLHLKTNQSDCRLPCNNLIGLFAFCFNFLYHAGLNQFPKHLFYRCLVSGSKVVKQGCIRLNVVGRFAIVGDKIKDVNLSHRDEI
jgi:hypothetical protein